MTRVKSDDGREATEAECALALVRLGFTIVRKGTTTPATVAELEAVVAAEARARKTKARRKRK